MHTGEQITTRTHLKTGSRIILGQHHVFRFNNPEEAKALRLSRPPSRSATGPTPANLSEWQAAQEELRVKQNQAIRQNMLDFDTV